MKAIKKTAIIFCISLFGTIAAAQVSFTAKTAKDAVMLDEPFEVSYEADAFFDELILPEQEEFELLSGPFKSTQQSTTIEGGKVRKEVSVIYTYVFRALIPGKLDFLPASLKIKEEYVESDTLSLIVIDQRFKQNQNSEMPSAPEGTTGI